MAVEDLLLHCLAQYYQDQLVGNLKSGEANHQLPVMSLRKKKKTCLHPKFSVCISSIRMMPQKLNSQHFS